jgi:hypothetical protein
MADDSSRQAFMSVLGCLPDGHWFCYSSEKFDGATRGSSQWSVASILNIPPDALETGVQICRSFKSNGIFYQHVNLVGITINVHKMLYGFDRVKKLKCKWLCVGASPPNHTPKDQVEGRSGSVMSERIQLTNIHEWMKIVTTPPPPPPPPPPPAPPPPPITPDPLRQRQCFGRIPVTDMKNNHRKRKAVQASLLQLCKSMQVDISNQAQVSKMMNYMQSATGYVYPEKPLTPHGAMELHFRKVKIQYFLIFLRILQLWNVCSWTILCTYTFQVQFVLHVLEISSPKPLDYGSR